MRILRTPRTAATHDLNVVQRMLLRALNTTRGGWVSGPLRVLADLSLPFRHGLRWDLSAATIEADIGPQDIVVATSPDPAVFDTGARLARHWHATWAVDYRDPWNVMIPEVAKDIITHQGSGVAGALRSRRMRRLERRFCAHADLMTAVSKAFLANAQELTGNPHGAVVHGGFDADPQPGQRVPEERFILTHTGQLYPEQPWPAFFNVLLDLRREHPDLVDRLCVRFIGAASTDPGLMQELKRMAVTGLIEQHPAVSPQQALEAQHGSDELLQLALTGRKGYLPVKFLEYLGARRPILLMSDEEDEMEAALRATRTGTVVRGGIGLREHLMETLRRHRAGEQPAYHPDEQELLHFHYARNMGIWADLLQAAFDRRRAPR
jgi:hypothetical protein